MNRKEKRTLFEKRMAAVQPVFLTPIGTYANGNGGGKKEGRCLHVFWFWKSRRESYFDCRSCVLGCRSCVLCGGKMTIGGMWIPFYIPSFPPFKNSTILFFYCAKYHAMEMFVLGVYLGKCR